MNKNALPPEKLRSSLIYAASSVRFINQTIPYMPHVTNDKIIASGVLSTMGEGGDSSKNNVSIEMTKVNDNWIITKYDVQ